MSLEPLPSYVLNISDTGPYRISNDNIVKNKIRLALLLNAIDGRLHHNYSYTHVKINDNIYDLENSIKSKKSYGGTSFENVKKMIKKYKKESK